MKIIIEGKPVSLKRPRVVNHGGHTFAYDPSKKDKDIALFQIKSKYKNIKKLSVCPIAIKIKAYMPIPKSLSKKKKKALLNTYHIKRPDSDNIGKFVLDLLEDVCYEKDENICKLQIEKIYSEHPRTEIEIKKIKEKAI